MRNTRKLQISLHFGKKLQIRTSAVGMALNFGHRSRSHMPQILGYGRRPSAFGPTLITFIRVYLVSSNMHLQISFEIVHAFIISFTPLCKASNVLQLYPTVIKRSLSGLLYSPSSFLWWM